jgi:hypothetical protein
MLLRRIAVATTAAVLILAAPAAASTAAGPSPTPLILELILAAIVIAGMAVRRPVGRAFNSVRGAIGRPRRQAAARRAVERRV